MCIIRGSSVYIVRGSRFCVHHTRVQCVHRTKVQGVCIIRAVFHLTRTITHNPETIKRRERACACTEPDSVLRDALLHTLKQATAKARHAVKNAVDHLVLTHRLMQTTGLLTVHTHTYIHTYIHNIHTYITHNSHINTHTHRTDVRCLPRTPGAHTDCQVRSTHTHTYHVQSHTHTLPGGFRQQQYIIN